jgi:hypothetical protein
MRFQFSEIEGAAERAKGYRKKAKIKSKSAGHGRGIQALKTGNACSI